MFELDEDWFGDMVAAILAIFGFAAVVIGVYLLLGVGSALIVTGIIAFAIAALI